MAAIIFKSLLLILFVSINNSGFTEIITNKSDSVSIINYRNQVDKTLKHFYSDILQLKIDSNRIKLLDLLLLAKVKGEKKLEADICNLLGDYYSRVSLNDSSINYYNKALEVGSIIDYRYYFPYISYKIANSYWEIGNYSQALENALLLKEFYEKENNLQDQAGLINLLGIIYLRLQDYPSALDNLQQSIRISERIKNYALMGVSYSNLGSVYFKLGKFVEALESYEKGVRLEEDNKMYLSAGRSYESIAKIYLSMNDPKKTEEFLEKAITYNQVASDINGFTRTYATYGKLYNYLKNYNKAIEYLKKAEDFASKSGLKEYYMNTCEEFVISYQNLHDFKNAFLYQKKYIDLYSQIYNIQDYTSIKKIENELRIEKKNNELNRIKIENQKFNTLLYVIVILLSTTISILFITMYLRSVRSRKSLIILNTEIQNQKENLEKINIELDESRKIADKANQLKSHFLRNISHEIRTPLNGIVGLSEFILNRNNALEEKQNYLSLIKNSSNQLITTIENLVEMANISTNQVETHISIVDPKELVTEIHNSYSTRLLNFNSKINFNCIKDINSNCCIKTDGDLLKKIILQLLDNAIKFTKEGDICIGYEVVEKKIRFFIKDTGIGISEESQKIIFESFRQEQENLTRDYEGVGIGLTIAKGLSELINAELSFESKKEQGTTFYITFQQEIC